MKDLKLVSTLIVSSVLVLLTACDPSSGMPKAKEFSTTTAAGKNTETGSGVSMVLMNAAQSQAQQTSTNSGSTSSGGDWNSGGGYAANGQFNPWFVQNTDVVRYCIARDEKNIDLTIEDARKSIKKAFEYWKQEFALSRWYFGYRKNEERFQLATQKFEEVACDDSEDLRIQLGYLESHQLERIAKPKNYLGLTVRTAYDPVNLRGKGFTYIAPTRGDFAPTQLQGVNDTLKASPEAYYDLLFTHEFGHIFGLTTSSHVFMRMNIMSELRDPDLTSKASPTEFNILNHLMVTPYPVEIRELCAPGVTPFPLPEIGPVKCIRMSALIRSSDHSVNVRFEYRETADSELKLFAEFHARNGGSTTVSDIGQVYITPEQDLITTKEDRFVPTEILFESALFDGDLIMTASKKKLATQLIVEPQSGRFLFTVHSWKDNPETAQHEYFMRFSSGGSEGIRRTGVGLIMQNRPEEKN